MSHWQTVEGLGIQIHVNCDKDLEPETMEALLKMVKLAYNKPTNMKLLEDGKVFPSDEQCVWVEDDAIYGGAHHYSAKKSTGFNNGKATYVEEFADLQFVQKNDDGSMIPGLQSEQLALILLDRAKKLNARFPSVYNDKMILGLNMFLEACKERVEDRINRGVMGDLKK